MGLPSAVDTVVVGAGHSGLAMSSFLSAGSRDHVVLDRRSSLGGGWQDRWDRFCLVSPNWSTTLPGQPYDGADPGGFMGRDEVVARVARYADTVHAPVALETAVERLSLRPGGGFRLETNQGRVDASNVVVATGSFHVPRLPPVASQLPATVEQLHSHDYRKETALAPGAVLIVGTGQSGVQIAEELMAAGREVYLSVGTAGRIPRRYRGRDIFEWLAALAIHGPKVGAGLPGADRLPDPRAKFSGNPHLSGHDGGHETNLRDFAAGGMTLLGRIERVDGTRLQLAPDLEANLARADRFFGDNLQPGFDRYIELASIDAPPDDRRPSDFQPPEPAELDLAAAGISTVIWATGYRLDYRWIDLPILDELGYPKHQRGVSEVPGLYFLGLMWQSAQPSATLFGPMIDGPWIARQMGLPAPSQPAAPVA